MVDGLDLEVQAKPKAREQSFHAQWCFSGLHSVGDLVCQGGLQLL